MCIARRANFFVRPFVGIVSKPPLVDVDHGNCALTLSVQTMPPVAYEANVGMAILAA